MFTLIDLPYAPDALAPVISADTIGFHHGKHLQGYVDNLNRLIAGTEFESMSLEEIVCNADGAIFNNAGQILNHNLYFTQFKPAATVMPGPTGHLEAQIMKQWGTVDAFKADFVANAEERTELRDELASQAGNATEETRKDAGQEIGADLMLTGTLNSIVDQEGGEQVIYYQVDLELTDIQSHRKVWVGDKKIKKFVSKDNVKM